MFLTNDKTLSIVEFQVLQLHSWSAVCVADKDQIPDLQRLLSSKPKVLSEFCVAIGRGGRTSSSHAQFGSELASTYLSSPWPV